MTESVPKLERLMNLVAALLHTRVPLSAAQLQERVGGYPDDKIAFRRQFSRDKDDLRELGIPILLEPVPGMEIAVDGYRIDPDDYYLADPGLDPDELAALHLATTLVPMGSGPDPTGLFKLGGLVDASSQAKGPMTSLPVDPNLSVLFDAVHRTSVVTFVHRDRPRHLVPRSLGFQNGRWYVTGWDVDASDDRVYRLDRIDGVVTITDATPEVPPGAASVGSMQPWSAGGDDVVKVTIHVDPVAVPAVRAQVPQDALHLADDGSATVTLDVANAQGFRVWLIEFGPAVQVLEPESVRAEIIGWLERTAQDRS